MCFPSDGRNHRNAIKNEHDTREYLQECAHLIYENVEKGKFNVISKGGTKNKADNIIECDRGRTINISDKQKKNGLGGSFDYTNTSKPIHTMLENGSESVKEIKVVLDSVKEDKKLSVEDRKKLVDSYRLRIKEASYAFLNSLSSDDTVDLIERYLIEPNKEMEMFITNGKRNNRYTFPFMNHPVVKLIENGYTASINVKIGKSSGRIIFSKGNEQIDVGLRIRVHTNNGVTALLGISSSNKSSQFVMKFQQDGIKKLLDTMGVSAIEI